MTDAQAISDHWGTGNVFSRIAAAMEIAGIDPNSVTIEQLAPVDHFHARGFAATVELADALPISEGDRLIDIGCGIGGPARYFAERFRCNVEGIDITAPFVDAANKLSALVRMEHAVECRHGDGQKLPHSDEAFDGGYTQHVTMNVPDRTVFFAEASRVLKPGAFFALTEHGLGEVGDPHHPVPWSEDGSGEYLMRPADTVAALENAGFTKIVVTDTGENTSGVIKQPWSSRRRVRPQCSAPIFSWASSLLRSCKMPRGTSQSEEPSRFRSSATSPSKFIAAQ